MLILNSAALFALIASVQAFVIPEGSADGVYAVIRDAAGTDKHFKLTFPEAVVEAREPDRELDSRFIGENWCGCGFTLNSGDTDQAVDALKAQLNGGTTIASHKSFYSVRGGVVAFACNRATNGGNLSANTFGVALENISDACGRYIAGARQLHISNGNGAMIVGYQRWKSGDDFCAASTTSPADHC